MAQTFRSGRKCRASIKSIIISFFNIFKSCGRNRDPDLLGEVCLLTSGEHDERGHQGVLVGEPLVGESRVEPLLAERELGAVCFDRILFFIVNNKKGSFL